MSLDLACSARASAPVTPAVRARKEGRRERRSRELRAHIYRVAQGLFLEHGFEATTVSQIAEAADIAPATFFNHFQGKGGVLDAMTAEVFEELERLVDEQLARPVSAQERISAFADRVAEEVLKVRDLAHDVLLGLMQLGLQRGEMAPHLKGLHEPFVQMLEEGQRAGEVRSDLAPAFLAELVVGALNGAITNGLNDPAYPLADRLRATAVFMGEAISPAPRGSAAIAAESGATTKEK
jgi:AcrR family transcriptional regulator